MPRNVPKNSNRNTLEAHGLMRWEVKVEIARGNQEGVENNATKNSDNTLINAWNATTFKVFAKKKGS